MKTVNLRDFYQSIYDHDCLYEVPDEVAELLILYKRREEAHRRLTYKYRAYFSLDCCDGIENEAVHNSPSAEEIFFRYADNVELCAALQRLTDIRQLRYRAFYAASNAAHTRRLPAGQPVKRMTSKARARIIPAATPLQREENAKTCMENNETSAQSRLSPRVRLCRWQGGENPMRPNAWDGLSSRPKHIGEQRRIDV